jgi:hypothetical protein
MSWSYLSPAQERRRSFGQHWILVKGLATILR